MGEHQRGVDKRWRVITPTGYIYVDTASECVDYKKKYGYGYSRNPDYKPKEND